MDGMGCRSLFWASSIASRLHQATVDIHYIRDNLMSMEFNGFLWLCCIFPNWFRVVLKYVFILYIIMHVMWSRGHWASSYRCHTKRSSTAPKKQNSRFNITLICSCISHWDVIIANLYEQATSTWWQWSTDTLIILYNPVFVLIYAILLIARQHRIVAATVK